MYAAARNGFPYWVKGNRAGGEESAGDERRPRLEGRVIHVK
jgi:hypothetical protein